MNLGDLLNTLATNAGIKQDDEKLKAILSNATISEYNIPDEVGSHIQSNLLTVEAAKNNPTLINHFRAQHFNGVDAELSKAFDELSLDESVRAELNSEKSTPKRAALAIKKIAELEKAKAGASKGDKAELQKEIDLLNGKLKTIVEQHKAQLEELSNKHTNDLIENDVNTLLSGYKYSLPDEMDMGLKLNTAKSVVNKYLEDKDAKLVRENGALKLVRKSTNTEYYDDKHSRVELKSLVDAALAQNKLLKTVEKTVQQPPAFHTAGNGGAAITESWSNAITEAKSTAV